MVVVALQDGSQMTTTTTIEDTVRETIRTEQQSRTGSQLFVHEQFDRESVGDRTVSRDLIPFMRSRNVEFISKKMKPLTRMHAFFDGEQVDKYCVPKLLEISMTVWNLPGWRNCYW